MLELTERKRLGLLQFFFFFFLFLTSSNETLAFFFSSSRFSVNMSFGLFRNFRSRTKPTQISEISTPIHVTKNVHVSYDPVTKTFHGLPPEWEEQVKSIFP